MDYRKIGNSQLFTSSRSGEKIVLDTDFNSDFALLKYILSLTNTKHQFSLSYILFCRIVTLYVSSMNTRQFSSWDLQIDSTIEQPVHQPMSPSNQSFPMHSNPQDMHPHTKK